MQARTTLDGGWEKATMDRAGKSAAIGKSGKHQPTTTGGEMLATGAALMGLVAAVEGWNAWLWWNRGEGRGDNGIDMTTNVEREQGRRHRREKVLATRLGSDTGGDTGNDSTPDVEDGAWKEGEGNRKQQRDRGDGRKNYDGKSKMGRNVISAGGARELQRRVVVESDNSRGDKR
ncbi:hypothetical protein BHE74_00029177 [Ensete ventricosum]|nr:hypothetical protein BHE74_00029177 [Ensete ventricosum]